MQRSTPVSKSAAGLRCARLKHQSRVRTTCTGCGWDALNLEKGLNGLRKASSTAHLLLVLLPPSLLSSSKLSMISFIKHFKDQSKSFLNASARHPLLNSNHPLDDQRRLEIREEIRRLESNYEQLTGHRWALLSDSSMKLPSSKVRDLGAQIRALLSLLAPIHRIPNEILEDILFFAAISNSNRTVMGRPEVNLGELGRLTLVCRRWNQIILGSQFLWPNIPPVDWPRCCNVGQVV